MLTMERTGGFFERIALAMAGRRNPWGKPGGGGDSGGDGDGGSDGGDAGGSSGGTPPGGGEGTPGPRNPWLPGGGGGAGGDKPRRTPSIEELFRQRGPEGPRRGGRGGTQFRMPQRPGGKSWWPLLALAGAGLWLFLSSVHFIQPREQAVVSWLGGKFSHTLQPGTNFTAPWPVMVVDKENVTEIKQERIPEGNSEEKLILTSDQNLVDLSYVIRWNISDLGLFRYQLEDPRDTLREVAEATMRASVARHPLDSVLTGEGRAEIEQDVRERMQEILDAYRSGIAVQGVEINKTDPPTQVEESFKDVSSAQQDADAAMNRARAYAQQLLARAQGDAAEFNQIYEQYRLAPEVTRQRLYYETMESVLSKTDKTIVEADGVTPYLPLPEVQRRARAAATGDSVTVTPQGGQ